MPRPLRLRSACSSLLALPFSQSSNLLSSLILSPSILPLLPPILQPDPSITPVPHRWPTSRLPYLCLMTGKPCLPRRHSNPCGPTTSPAPVWHKDTLKLDHQALCSSSPVLRRTTSTPTHQARSSPQTQGCLREPRPSDANNKVLLAIGRSFMSVDNRAMTIKDLAEMTIKYGLMCHKRRVTTACPQLARRSRPTFATICNDARYNRTIHYFFDTCYRGPHPMMTSFLLFILALVVHIAHRTSRKNRITNFRRGTMVWYLSKAAGAPCPFARAGIRLCDYNENGKIGVAQNPGRERKRERDRMRKSEQCGQKRKRLLRSCADKGSDSDSMNEEEKRPPKVKLTLRLKPCLVSTPVPPIRRQSDDSDSMSVDSSEDEEPATEPPSIDDPYPSFPSTSQYSMEDYRRSPSVPYSITSGTPPPDSEDEDEDYHISMTGVRRPSANRTYTPLEDEDEDDEDDFDWDGEFSADFDGDNETQWESPGPRSPSVQFEDDVVVKQEPTDVRGYLEAWDDLESRAADMKVIDVVAQAAAAELDPDMTAPKIEDLDAWNWEGFGQTSLENGLPYVDDDDIPYIKQEEVDTQPFFAEQTLTPLRESLSPMTPLSPHLSDSPVEERPLDVAGFHPYTSLQWRDVELLGPDSVEPDELEDGVWYRGREKSVSAVGSPRAGPSASPHVSNIAMQAVLSPQGPRVALPPPLDLSAACPPSDVPQADSSVVSQVTSPTLITSLTSLSLQTPATSGTNPFFVPSRGADAHDEETSIYPTEDVAVVLHTIDPCAPAISATVVEGVPRYQMTIGSSIFLRNIYEDAVKLSPIIELLEVEPPVIPDPVTISEGPASVQGTWVSSAVARDIAKGHPLLEVFLSEQLHYRFTPELLSAYRSNRRAWFTGVDSQAAILLRRRSDSWSRSEISPQEPGESWEGELGSTPEEANDISPHQIRMILSAEPGFYSAEDIVVVEAPLSPTEEEMFHVLCSAPEWEERVEGPSTSTVPAAPLPVVVEELPAIAAKDSPCHERPLRRSKRVANAIATRSRTRSTKRGSRSSLS
ncbi:hypothetical protein A0H81_04494 [Grifola frondosa]|uniref:HTH APSES-type domain-containing protein n=1 Tax=Grifola frondosa TaxID=5627 RepID=A0A1C7MFH9_GRIFR|nr:hypothetical protein A0H81_04494 [Grifola frondosa]